MSIVPALVIVHAQAATVWTCGHFVLDLGVLPRALREQSALAIQMVSGVWMGSIDLPRFQGLFNPDHDLQGDQP